MAKHLMITVPNATDEDIEDLVHAFGGIKEWDLTTTDLNPDFTDPDEAGPSEDEAADRKNPGAERPMQEAAEKRWEKLVDKTLDDVRADRRDEVREMLLNALGQLNEPRGDTGADE